VVHSIQIAQPSAQEDSAAIATLIRRILVSRGLKVQVKWRSDCLKILLEGNTVPDRRRWLHFLANFLSRLELPSIKRVYVYGRQIGSSAMAWTAILPVLPAKSKPSFKLMTQQASPPASDKTLLKSLSRSSSQTLQKSFSKSLSKSFPVQHTADIPPRHTSAPMAVISSEEVFLNKVKQEITQTINVPDLWVDLELEGLDLLITLETRQNIFASGALSQLKAMLKAMDLGRIKLVRIYQRHPRTQQSTPLQEVLLKALTLPTAKARLPKRTPAAAPIPTNSNTLISNTLIMVGNEAEPAQLEFNSQAIWAPEQSRPVAHNSVAAPSLTRHSQPLIKQIQPLIKQIQQHLTPILNSRLGKWSLRVVAGLVLWVVLQQLYHHVFVLHRISALWSLASILGTFALWRGLVALGCIIRSCSCK
jgi:hypothetical protein